MNKHLPYNILLLLAATAVGVTSVFNLALRQSSFAVTVGYRLPSPAPAVSQPAEYTEELPALYEEPPPQPPPQVWPEPDTPDNNADDTLYSVQFPLELNEATAQQLMFIPNVGNVTAQRIVQYREHLGGYTSLHQLLEIKGIGAATFGHITAYLYLDEEADGQLDEDSPAKEDESDISP